jgi:putative transposase
VWEVAKHVCDVQAHIHVVKGALEPSEPAEGAEIERLKKELFAEFAGTSLSGVCPVNPPIRGPFGEAEIWLKPDARPVSVPPFRLAGERREAHAKLIDDVVESGKVEPGRGPWNTPSFPVPKKRPGEYRLVQDLRPQNAATLKDGHPLPLIGAILERQGKFKMWSVLDLTDGYHQMPMKPEHRHITCMSTPRGTMQWKVQVMGLKNAGAQFQRMMEWVLRDLDCADPYIDDIIVGSNGETVEELLRNHARDVRRVLDTLRQNNLVCSPKKSHFFMRQVEFCGHILREGARSPAPGKLLPIQEWQLPGTITELRGFLGLCNYFSEYVDHYADYAAPLMEKLKVGRVEGKKGSRVRVEWTPSDVQAFECLKRQLAKELELFQLDPDRPFVMRCDASDFAIGAVLQQVHPDEERTAHVDIGKVRLVPVSFFSRKLTGSQLNWTPREKETYAIVAALRKWAGHIGYQPVIVVTDHRSLQDWVTEHVDTPSGPRGRRARWHETLSQFDVEVVYMPGPTNVVADALSRYAYPATSAREDVSFHGSEAVREDVKK